MQKHFMRSIVIVAMAAGIMHFGSHGAKAIELLVIVTQNIGRATEQADRQVDRTWGYYVDPVEDTYVEDDLDTLVRLLQQANWELDVVVRHHERQVANIGKGAVSIELLEPIREAARQTVRDYAVDAWFDLIDAAGGVDIVLDPGDDHPGNSPRW